VRARESQVGRRNIIRARIGRCNCLGDGKGHAEISVCGGGGWKVFGECLVREGNPREVSMGKVQSYDRNNGGEGFLKKRCLQNIKRERINGNTKPEIQISNIVVGGGLRERFLTISDIVQTGKKSGVEKLN